MSRSRPPSTPRPPRRPWRKRLTSLASLACAVALCALGAGALFGPTFVFGSPSESPHPGPELVVESTEVPLGPSAGALPASAGGAGAPAAESEAAAEPAAAPSGADAFPGADAGTVLVTLPWGAGAGQVGLAQPTEGLTRGPEALAVAPDGRIVVLDSVNRRLVFLDSTGQVTGTASLPLAEPRFLAVTSDRIYVLDCDADRSLLTLYWSGAICWRGILPDLPDVVTGLFATGRGPCVEVAHSQVYRATSRTPGKTVGDSGDSGTLQSADLVLSTVAGRPADLELTRTVTARFVPGLAPVLTSTTPSPAGPVIQSADLDLALPEGGAVEHLVSIDGDLGAGLVVGARLLEDGDGSQPARLVLARFVLAADGNVLPATTLEGAADALLLIDSSSAYVGLPYMVAPDGRVFQPIATDAGYTIVVHTFPSEGGSDNIPEVQP